MSGTRIALTPKAWEVLAHTLPPVKGICRGCRQLAYIWDGKVACVDRTGERDRYCPGNGLPPGYDPELTALAESLADTWDRTPPDADIRTPGWAGAR